MTRRKPAHKPDLIEAPIVIESEVATDAPMDDSKCPIAMSDIQPWFEMVVGDHPVRFGFVSEALLTAANAGDACYALTWAQPGIVVFDKALKKNRSHLAIVLLHELVHIGLGASYGSDTVTARLLGAKTNAQHNDREEAIAAYFSDKLATPLLLAGVLKLPKIPR